MQNNQSRVWTKKEKKTNTNIQTCAAQKQTEKY